MSGFDTSQPITDETILREADLEGQIGKGGPPDGETTDESADADELGDATPGPR